MTPKCPDCKRDQDSCICVDYKEQIKTLTAERDTYKQALDDLGVTPTEAKAGVARSKALLAERDALKAALENADSYESEARRLLLVVIKMERKNDRLRAALEKLLHLDDTSYLTQNWGLSSEQIKVIKEALAKVK